MLAQHRRKREARREQVVRAWREELQRHGQVVIAHSHLRVGLSIVGSLAFVALGIFMLVYAPLLNDLWWAALIMIAIFGGWAAMLFTRIVGGPAIVVETQGLTLWPHRRHEVVVPWTELAGALVADHGRGPRMLHLSVAPEAWERYLATRWPLFRWAGRRSPSFMQGIDVGPMLDADLEALAAWLFEEVDRRDP